MTELQALRRDYRVAFLGYLTRRDEQALARGYDLGRLAVAGAVSILDIVRVHHEVLIGVLAEAPPEDLGDIGTAGAEFLVEVMAPYDMAQRGLLRER